MYVDASAILAILLREPESIALSGRMRNAPTSLITSPVSVLEAILNLATRTGIDGGSAEEAVDLFLDTMNIESVSITPQIGRVAVTAYLAYGKGYGAAGLNMGDVFAYACAKAHQVPLLYKGDDFSHTDLA